jgi:hypothetical protein
VCQGEHPETTRHEGDSGGQTKPSQAELLEGEHADEPGRLRILCPPAEQRQVGEPPPALRVEREVDELESATVELWPGAFSAETPNGEIAATGRPRLADLFRPSYRCTPLGALGTSTVTKSSPPQLAQCHLSAGGSSSRVSGVSHRKHTRRIPAVSSLGSVRTFICCSSAESDLSLRCREGVQRARAQLRTLGPCNESACT